MKTLFDDDLTINEAKALINQKTVNCTDALNRTPLFYTADIHLARLLIENGADVYHKDIDDSQPLRFARNIDVVKLLIENGATINSTDKLNRTALHYVSDIEIARFLISLGCDVNHADKNGVTPIFWCTYKNICQELIKNGAKLNIKSVQNLTPLHVHLSMNHTEIIKMLIQHGAVPSIQRTYKINRQLFTEEQQKAFDAFSTITNNDEDFFQMCLAYQEGLKNKIDIKNMDIL